MIPDDLTRVTVRVTGRVQGVGFRWWTREQAGELGLLGSATNLPDGRVHIVAEGTKTACDALLTRLRSQSAPGHVRSVSVEWGDARGDLRGFSAH
jgi:acylphosphatase